MTATERAVAAPKEPLQEYRDDGPIAETLAPGTGALPIPPVLATPLAVLFLVLGAMVDGRATGVATIVGVVAFIALGSAGAVKPPKRRIQWLTPPLLRATEYAFLAFLGWRAGLGSLPQTYALLAAIAFHHYDVVYRLRHQKVAPPAWVARAGLGWDGRLALMVAASVAGFFEPLAMVLAIWCGALFVIESVGSWVRLARDTGRSVAMAAEDDEE